MEFSPSNAQKLFIATQYVQEYCLQEATSSHVATDIKAEAINTCLHHNSDFAHTLNAACGIGLPDLEACGRTWGGLRLTKDVKRKHEKSA